MRQNENILFKDWNWNESLERLDNMVRHSDSIVLVSGPGDCGKSTLKQELSKLLANNFKMFTMDGEQKIGVATLIRQVTIGFGLSYDNNVSASWGELQKAIFSQPNCRWILLVDDAEKLSWDTLNSLISLYNTVGSEGSQFSLMFFADVSLESSLKQSVLKDFFENKFQTINLKPLTFDQTAAFLNSINFTFDHKTLKKIYNASSGIIGKVKQLAITELHIKKSDEHYFNAFFKNLLKNIINPSVIKVSACCSLLVGSYFLFGVVQKTEEFKFIKPEITTASVPEILESKPLEPQNLELATVEPVTLEPATVELNNLDTNSLELVNLEPKKPESPDQELYQKLYSDLKTHLEEHMQAELTKLEQKLINNNLASSTEKNLLSISKNRYTLQIMASKHQESVKKLLNSHPTIFSNAKCFRGKFKPNQEEAWFVVVLGSYDNKELAINDLKNLPLDIQNLKPMVRNYGAIHQLINNNQL